LLFIVFSPLIMEYIQIGFTKKTHGVSGELKIAIDEVFEDLFLSAERVFIEVKGNKMPFFIENIRGGGELIVHFEDITNKDQALLIQSKGVFLPSSEVPASLEIADDSLEYSHLEGFSIIDKEAGVVGTIEEVLDMPQQEMALIVFKNREILIPLNDALILKIDKKQKTVHVELPDGLLDL
jgi:16S rRNA processing protein RimM